MTSYEWNCPTNLRVFLLTNDKKTKYHISKKYITHIFTEIQILSMLYILVWNLILYFLNKLLFIIRNKTNNLPLLYILNINLYTCIF